MSDTVDGAPSEAYLKLAQDAGLLAEHPAGRYVAGLSTDPVTGEVSCLVEYADPALLTAPALGELTRQLCADHPAARALVVRVAAPGVLPAPWLPRQTYLRLPCDTGEATRADTEPDGDRDTAGCTVRRAVAADTGQVRRWLAEAIEGGARDLGAVPDAAVALEQAGAVTDDPDRVSFVAVESDHATTTGEPLLGHVTLVPFEDELTGAGHLELVDVLVVPGPQARAARAALVAAARRHAAAVRLPLLGHVVHPHPAPAGGGHAAAVLAGLRHEGWRDQHSYWWRALPSA
ncbi:hypothetical protein ACFV1W_21450 [Kitasatospora sp. NPDC059648]|uniref:hypothetical protein n=1 Tax=Kitasatospora sp. NPDC059648 TaxID=3346894 RepID=UPI003693C961